MQKFQQVAICELESTSFRQYTLYYESAGRVSGIFLMNLESESESEMYLFDPHKKCIHSNNEKI